MNLFKKLSEINDSYLQHIGKADFIKFYEMFKFKEKEDCKFALRNINKPHNSVETIVSCSKQIFKNGKEKEALAIIALSKGVEYEYRKQAAKLLAAEFE